MLDQGLEPEGESRGDRVEEGDHVDTREVGHGRVDGSEVEGVVGAEVVVFDLNHRVAGRRGELRVTSAARNVQQRGNAHLGLNLGRVDGAPCLVGPRGDGSGVVDTSLQECLRMKRNGSAEQAKKSQLARTLLSA